MKTPKNWLKPLPWLIGLALILWVFRTIPLRDTLATFRQLNLPNLSGLILINIVAFISIATRWWLILWGLGHRIPLYKSILYRLASFGVSYFTPGPQFGGEIIQVSLIEKQHAVPRTTALASVALDKTIELLVNFTFLAIGILILLQHGILGGSGPATYIPFFLLLLPISYLIAIYLEKTPVTALLSVTLNPFGNRFQALLDTTKQSEHEVIQFCHHHPIFFSLALLSALFGWLIIIVEFWLMYNALGLQLAPFDLVAVLTAVRLAFLAPTPGALGALEASQIIATQTLGLNPIIGASASLLIRARDVLLGLLGLWIGLRYLSEPQKLI